MPTNKKIQEENMKTPEKSSSSIKFLFSFLVVVIFAVFVQQIRPKPKETTEKLFTKEQLEQFKEEKLFLAILGHVFDVSSAPQFYSKTGSYGHFTGRDASRSFYTGKTSSDDLTDDLTGLDDEAISAVFNWLNFYQKNYPEIGKLIGRYFTSDGSASENFEKVVRSAEKMKKKKEEQNSLEKTWPPCNSEWSQSSGRRVWCSTKSGGIERNWVGFPRRFFDKNSRDERCACVENLSQIDGRFKEFANCPSNSIECRIED